MNSWQISFIMSTVAPGSLINLITVVLVLPRGRVTRKPEWHPSFAFVRCILSAYRRLRPLKAKPAPQMMLELGNAHNRSSIIETPMLPLHSPVAQTNVQKGVQTAPDEREGINPAISMNTIFSDIDEEAVPHTRTTLTEDMLASFEEVKDGSFGEVIMSRHWVYIVFLGLGGLLWDPCRDLDNISPRAVMQNALMVVILLALSIVPGLSVENDFLSGFDYPSQIAVSSALFVQVIEIGIATFFVVRRLQCKCRSYEATIYPAACVATLKCVVTSSCLVLAGIYILVGNISRGWHAFLYVTFSSAGIGGTTSFVFLDAFAADAALKQFIHSLRLRGPFDPETVHTVVNEVHHIVSNGFITNSVVTTVALFNVIIVFALGVFTRGNLSLVVGLALVWLSKELVFAVAILYSIACVNETSTELVSEVGIQFAKLDAQDPNGRRCLLEMNQVLQYLLSNPVNFPILGMVLSRKDVAFRFGIWAFGLLLSGITRVNWAK
jgi:hypothetical protein